MSARGKHRLLVAAGVVIAAAAAGTWGWRSHETRSQIRAGRPALPSLQGWPEEFRRQVLAAAQRDTPTALGELSALYHANGFIPEAMRCYTLLETLQPADPRWPHRHATLLAGFGDIEPALLRWHRVATLAADPVPALLRIADALAKTNRSAEAATAYAQVLQRKPDEPYALLGLARLDIEAGRWDAARPRLESVVRQTNYDLGYDLLVSVYEQLGLTVEAADLRGRTKAAGTFREPPDPWLDELMEYCFDTYRLSLAAGSAARNGGRETALRLLERAVGLAPDDVSIRFQLAGLHTQRGDPMKARAELERCTRLAPTFPDAWAHLSALLESGGDRRGAEQVLTTGLQHCPQSPGLHLMRARQLREAGQLTAAIDSYRASIRFRPNEADAPLELATTLFRLERVPEGLQALQQALTAEPDHPMALALLAFHAISEKDEPAARQWMTAMLAQPRVPREQREQLLAAYRKQFGRDAR